MAKIKEPITQVPVVTKDELVSRANEIAGKTGLVISDYAGLLGPIVFSMSGDCGHISRGVTIDFTYQTKQGKRLLPGVISRDDAKRLYDWLGKTLSVEQP
jgi:hypothetical protein